MKLPSSRVFALCALMVGAGSLTGCGGGAPRTSPNGAHDARRQGDGSRDLRVLGRWLLAEMLAPEGDAEQARKARKQVGDALAKLDPAREQPPLEASLGAALYDQAHGQAQAAADHFLSTLRAARTLDPHEGAVYGWLAASHLVSLRGSVRDLYSQQQPELQRLIEAPGAIGWRALAVLLEWSNAERAKSAETVDAAFEQAITSQLGCAEQLALVGPFGSGVTRDLRTAWPPQQPGPWPAAFDADPLRGTEPKRLEVGRVRCTHTAKQAQPDGVVYAESYFDLSAPRDLLIAVQGAYEVWVDDVRVLVRDPRQFGSWQRFGARVKLGQGRHRVVAKLAAAVTTVRLLNPDGTSAELATDVDSSKPYGLEPPTLGANPNVLERAVQRGPSGDVVYDFATAYLAHIDGMDDVANWLLEPHVKTGSAGAVLLGFAATFARGDAAYGAEARRNNEKALHERATRRDEGLWYSQAWLWLDQAARQSPQVALKPLRELAAKHPEQPELSEQLARLYAKLGYDAERLQLARDLGARFPDDLSTQKLVYETESELGQSARADAAAARIRALDPDSEIDLELALARLDFKAALSELERLQKRKPQRKDLSEQIARVLLASGQPQAALDALAKAVADNPEDAQARLRLADRRFAEGDPDALRRALADSIAQGVAAPRLREAIELLEGQTALEPYRRDGQAIIKEFAAWEKQGKRMSGSAARVLDYAALWVHPDGSSEMLEHEIIKIQSQEALARESEQRPPEGLVLKLRVIKADGTIFEPQEVPGKPTLTMPHLDVGDYVEMEHITRSGGEARGLRYAGPSWFFAEPDRGYFRSEFVALSPKRRDLEIETRGAVPAPSVIEHGSVVERRWVVRESPAAPEEPNGPPAQEFLPSVRIGWGVSLADQVQRFEALADSQDVKDPRFVRRAEEIVRGIPASQIEARARKLYREVQDTVQDGQENDGRRALTARSGSRQAAFTYLLRQLDIPYDFALVQNKLAPPAQSQLSEADSWASVALRLRGENGPLWLTVRDKFAPFGYLPAELRDQAAIVLNRQAERTKTSADGSADELRVEGRLDLRKDGSAQIELTQTFVGKLAISMRNLLERVPEAQLADFVETRLIGSNVPGLRVRSVKPEGQSDHDAPVTLKVQGEAIGLAKRQGDLLVLPSMFPLNLSQFAELPSRQTPLFLDSASRMVVKLQVVVPEGLTLPDTQPTQQMRFQGAEVLVQDRIEGRSLRLDRSATVPAMRVLQGADYNQFADFVHRADAVFEREWVIRE